MMAQSTSHNEPWPGNLPCCHGPKDGCAAHNPNRLPIFWNPSLPSPIKPVTDNLLKSLFTAKSKNDSDQSQSATQPTITSLLPQTPSVLDPLPLIHSSVPYTISLYHLHALSTSSFPAHILPSLTCHGTTTSSPRVTWRVTPLLHPPNNLLLAHAYTLLIPLPLGAAATLSDTGSYSYQKIPLRSPIHNVYSFRVCPHNTCHLRTLVMKVAKGVASVRVEHGLKNALGQEIKGEWRSEAGRQPEDMACGLCCSDFGMVFQEMVGGKKAVVSVTVTVWKDLGTAAADGAGGEKWEAARGGKAMRREREDFGRVRRVFETAQDGNGGIKCTRGIDSGADVEQAVTNGAEAVNEDDSEFHVADGLQPPPPYAP